MTLTKKQSEQIKTIPEQSGIYFFYDKTGKLLYIGQSVNLKSRVKNHLSGLSHLKDLIKNIAYISIMLADKNELDNLEMMLIYKNKPKFNDHGKRKGQVYRQYALSKDVVDFLDKVPPKLRSDFVNNILEECFTELGVLKKENSNSAILETIKKIAVQAK